MSLSYFSVVLVSVLPDWVIQITNYQVNPRIWISCQLGYFLIYFSVTYSSAILVIISTEKCFALYFPFRSKYICTVRTARRVSLVTALIYAGFYSQLFYFAKKGSDWLGSYCYFYYPSNLHDEIFFGIHSTLYTLAPFAVVVSANFAIIYKLIKAKLKTAQNNIESTEQALSKSATRGTAMLLTVSFAFIILTGPISLIQIFNFKIKFLSLIHAICVVLSYTNHGINGFLYCASGTRFRNEIKNTFCCFIKSRQTSLPIVRNRFAKLNLNKKKVNSKE